MKVFKGFTLIELLITITIIAILSTIGLVAYSTFLKNARDAKRQSDLKLIQSALEQYHSDQIAYPYQIKFGEALTANDKTYLSKIPNDSLITNPPYLYVASGANCSALVQNCTSYCLFVKIEGTPPPNDPGCTPTSSSYNYGVSKP